MPLFLSDCKQNFKMQAQLVSAAFDNSDQTIIQNQSLTTPENICNNQQMLTITTSPTSKNPQKTTLSGIPSNIANVFMNKPGITINRVVSTHNPATSVSTPMEEPASNSFSPSNKLQTSKVEVKDIEEPAEAVPISPGVRTVNATFPEFKCKICSKSFKKKEHMTQHNKLHAGIRPFKCNENYCNKSFSRKEHLMRHMVSHTGKKLFHCDICQKYFSRKDNLNKHRRTHTENSNNNGEFVCEICQKCFVVKMYYVQHKLQCFKEVSQTSNNVKMNET